MPFPFCTVLTEQQILCHNLRKTIEGLTFPETNHCFQLISHRSLLHIDPSARPQTADCLRHSYLAGIDSPSSWPHSSMHSNNTMKPSVSGESVGSCLGTKVCNRILSTNSPGVELFCINIRKVLQMLAAWTRHIQLQWRKNGGKNDL